MTRSRGLRVGAACGFFAVRGRLPSWQGGLTLLELMVAVAVLSILVLVAMPSFTDLVQTQRIKGAAEIVQSDLMLARSEAVRRNAPVYVKLSTGASGCLGIGTTSCSSCRPEVAVADGRCDLKTTDLSPISGEFPSVQLSSASATDFQFTAIRGAPSAVNPAITLASTGANPSREITVKLSFLGLTSVCSPSGGVGLGLLLMFQKMPRSPTARRAARNQARGLSLIELMVSLTIGLAVLSGVLGMLTSSVRANADSVKAIRLNQEMRAAMDLMARDIRRAGYRKNFGDFIGSGQSFDNTLRVLDDGARVQLQYDENDDKTLSADTESFGFKLDAGALKYTRNAEAGTPDWQAITDPNVTTFTALSFCFWPSASAQCLTQVPGDAKFTLTGSAQVSVYAVRITMNAQIKNDAATTRRLTETIRVRNDRFDK